jgi:rare lipoprotein A
MRTPGAIPYRRIVVALCLALLAGSCAGRKRPVTSTDLRRYEERGIASYYGKKFHGRMTANGERFDMRELTAAHRTLPFGTVVRVTNLNNGREVRVRINDRGPWVKGRIIDLSRGAAKKLDMIRDGIVPVRIKVVGQS